MYFKHMIKIIEIDEKKIWDEFLDKKEIQFFPLFQSWNWGEVQKQTGDELLRVGAYKNNKLVAVCQIIDIRAKRGHYLHLRHGPVLVPFDQSVFNALLVYVKKVAYERQASFIRLSPLVEKHQAGCSSRSMINAPIHNMDAQVCWVLDITKPEEQLLKEMRKSHRYLIRKAQGMSITIKKTKEASRINIFLKIYKDLSSRRHFVPHRGIKEELGVFGKEDQALLFLAEYKQKVIGGALILFVGNNAIYHHGASLSGYRDVPISYLLQWEAILEAKRRGKKLYNFWGIAPSDSPRHPWKGLTLFKTGFGGERKEFLHAQDLPLRLSYWKSYAIESIYKWKRGYWV